MIHYEMPKEIRSYVLRKQADIKIKKGNGKFSQQQTITAIIKEHMELTKQNNDK